jgi:hypothetical protein
LWRTETVTAGSPARASTLALVECSGSNSGDPEKFYRFLSHNERACGQAIKTPVPMLRWCLDQGETL